MTLLTFDEFIAKYTNEPMDYDGSFGNQCVDLFRFYLRDVLGVPQAASVGGASELAINYDPKLFDWIPNTILAVPQKGDVLIWKATKGNPSGHVAIFIEGNMFKFKSFDINYPSQGYVNAKGVFIGTGVAHIQEHNYNNVLGWLRVKKQPQEEQNMPNYYPVTEPHIDLSNLASVKVAVDTWVKVVTGGSILKEDHEKIILDLKKQLNDDKNSAVQKALEDGKAIGRAEAAAPNQNSQPAATGDLAGYEEVSLSTEITEGNTKTIRIYTRKS